MADQAAEALADAVAEARSHAAPCPTCGSAFVDTWSSTDPPLAFGDRWHCAICGLAHVIEDPARCKAEVKAMSAVAALDAAVAPEQAERHRQMLERGVKVGFLKEFVASIPEEERYTMTTAQTVVRLIRPKTEATRCRYVELPEMSASVGRAKAMCSHTWGAPFAHAVAAVAQVFDDDDCVWFDTFAVRQWPGNGADVDFEPIVQGTDAFVLVGLHMDEVMKLPAPVSGVEGGMEAGLEAMQSMGIEDMLGGDEDGVTPGACSLCCRFCCGGAGKVAAKMRDATELDYTTNLKSLPPVAFRLCAFFRVWCVRELATAAEHAKPVLMFVGSTDASGFKPDASSLSRLLRLVDVEACASTVPEDKVRILDELREGIGTAAVNSLARGALAAAEVCMEDRVVLRAALGKPSELLTLPPRRKNAALTKLALGGYIEPLRAVLAESPATPATLGRVLKYAASGGSAAMVRLLVGAGADVEGGAAAAAAAALEAADADGAAADDDDDDDDPFAALGAGWAGAGLFGGGGAQGGALTIDECTPLMVAARGGHLAAVCALLDAGAHPDSRGRGGVTALMLASRGGSAAEYEAVVSALIARGATVNLTTDTGDNALTFAAFKRHERAMSLLVAHGACCVTASCCKACCTVPQQLPCLLFAYTCCPCCKGCFKLDRRVSELPCVTCPVYLQCCLCCRCLRADSTELPVPKPSKDAVAAAPEPMDMDRGAAEALPYAPKPQKETMAKEGKTAAQQLISCLLCPIMAPLTCVAACCGPCALCCCGCCLPDSCKEALEAKINPGEVMGRAQSKSKFGDSVRGVRGEPRVGALDNAPPADEIDPSVQDEAAEASWEDVLAKLGEPAAGGGVILSADDEQTSTSFANKKLLRFGNADGLAESLPIGLSSRKGLKPGTPNQDACAVVHLPELSLYFVADGHGQNGHAVAQWAANALPRRVVLDGRLGTAETGKALLDGFKGTQDGLVAPNSRKRADCHLSGATCAAVVHDRSRQELVIANVGTVQAVLGCGTDKTLTAVRLTAEHKPNMAAERERIEMAGGCVVFDGYQTHHVYTKSAPYPGLPMSRCLGDVLGHRDCGLSASPDVQQRGLGAEDRLLLLCSDGVWEMMTPQEAVDIVAKFSREKAAVAAERLVKEAWDRWINEEGGALVDDITVMVVFLV